MKSFISMMVLLVSFSSLASSEGIDPVALKNYKVTGYSRPCCTFGLDYVGNKMGINGVIDNKELGSHNFARLNKQKDNVGMVYTCSAGFVDISHLRDNADWSAHIYFNLRQWLGSGREIIARREGGFKQRSILFPALSPEEIKGLTEDDLELIAISAGFSMALLHEIPTAFNFPVSAPAAVFTNEKSSAFSVEDAYSNLLGNILGVKAARDSRPYNQAMTSLIASTLKDLQAQPAAHTFEAYEIVRNTWWINSFNSGFKNILKRNFTHQGMVQPYLVRDIPFCSGAAPQEIEIPERLSNGKSVHDYYQIQGMMNKKMKSSLSKLGLKINNPLTQYDYAAIIEAIREDFIDQLGPNIETY